MNFILTIFDFFRRKKTGSEQTGVMRIGVKSQRDDIFVTKNNPKMIELHRSGTLLCGGAPMELLFIHFVICE